MLHPVLLETFFDLSESAVKILGLDLLCYTCSFRAYGVRLPCYRLSLWCWAPIRSCSFLSLTGGWGEGSFSPQERFLVVTTMLSRSSNNNLRNPPRGRRAVSPQRDQEWSLWTHHFGLRSQHQTPQPSNSSGYITEESTGYCQLVGAIVWLCDLRNMSVVIKALSIYFWGIFQSFSSSLFLTCKMRLLKTPPQGITPPLYSFLKHISPILFSVTS